MAERRRQRLGETATEHEILTLFTQFGFHCLACGDRPAKLTVDHIVPVSRGGASTLDNLQPLCLNCNVAKGTNAVDYRPLWADPLAPPDRDTLRAHAAPRTAAQQTTREADA